MQITFITFVQKEIHSLLVKFVFLNQPKANINRPRIWLMLPYHVDMGEYGKAFLKTTLHQYSFLPVFCQMYENSDPKHGID